MSWHLVALDLLIHTAAGGSLLLLAAALAVRCCRQPVRRVRLIELALAGALLLPLASQLPVLPRWSAGLLPRGAESPALAPPESDWPADPVSSPGLERSLALRAEAEAAVARAEPVVAPPAEPSPAASAASPPPDEPAPIAWQWLVVIGYGCAVAALLGRSLVGLARLWWLCHKASPAPREVRDLFDGIAGDAGRRTRLLASDAVEVPLVAAGWRPTILLPGGLCRGGDTAALRYSLAHEWSHVERGDVWRWWLATVAQPLFFYQPLFWWLRGQLRLCQDYLADARAAEQADEAEDYAAYLVALARRRLGVPAGALGMGGGRSYLHRRVMMLLQSHRPLERRCFAAWTLGAGLAALALLLAVSAARLDAEGPKAPKKETPKESPKDKDKDKPAEKGETLRYTGKVTDKDTGKPIAGATVRVRRSLSGDPEVKEEDRLMEESKHKTDADGKYTFTIPPEQSSKRYLYIELDVEHPDYAPRKRFGYALGMIRKNEKMGGRPFFEHVSLRPGKAITGRILTPDGKPAAGVKVLAYSNTDKQTGEYEYGSFADARTDAKGDFKVTLITPGPAVFWILPEEHAPSAHGLKDDKRGDLGTFTLSKGVRLRGTVLDAQGKPLAGVHVNAEARERSEELPNLPVADHVGRSATTNAKGEFVMGPLPPGKYRVKPDEHGRDPSKDSKDRAPRRPLTAVFIPQTVTLKDGENKLVEIRAAPHVTIEAQYLDSKGKPTRGHDCHLFGRIDNEYWFGIARADGKGKIVINVPHGLEKAELSLSTNEHGVLRWRKAKGEALNNSRKIDLGTLDDHVKGIEIVRYTAPILVINAKGKDGKPIKGFKAQVAYAKGKSPKDPNSFFVNGVKGDVYLAKQGDGRWRSSQLLPDEEVTVSASADGYQAASVKVKLPEGEVKELTLELEKAEPKKKDSKGEKKEKEKE